METLRSKPEVKLQDHSVTMKPAVRYLIWILVGVGLFLGFVLLLRNHEPPDRAAQLALKAKRIELVERMRLALASASEAEKSAVMAVTDKDSQTYADQARAAAAKVEQARNELAESLKSADQNEQGLLAQFSQAFAGFQRIDADLLDLAVKNTNLKASSLAFGPAATALNEMDAALSRVIAAGSAAAANDLRITQLADAARIAALRIQTLLPPHIAEESNQKMDELEAMMAKEDSVVRHSLQALATMPILSDNPDLKMAVSSYDRFGKIKAEILKLSRENTNVRSVAISLNQKRNVMFQCQDSLAALQSTIENQSVVGVPARVPVSQ
jgi:hypothetical protein